jgi:hypothetical protein
MDNLIKKINKAIKVAARAVILVWKIINIKVIYKELGVLKALLAIA